jgi:hypothetical protein
MRVHYLLQTSDGILQGIKSLPAFPLGMPIRALLFRVGSLRASILRLAQTETCVHNGFPRPVRLQQLIQTKNFFHVYV